MRHFFYHCLCLFVGFVAMSSCNQSVFHYDESMGDRCSAQQMQAMRTGDIVLRHGDGMLSQRIVEALDEEVAISHCGILVEQEGGWTVIHALSRTVAPRDGVQQCSLADFLREARPGSFYVVRARPAVAGESIAHEALRLLDKALPFDYSFDYQDSTAMYCLEFVRHCLQAAQGGDIFEMQKGQKNSHLRMGVFLDTLYFRKI